MKQSYGLYVLLILVLLLLAGICHAQSICVSVDCKDSVKYPVVLSLNGIVTSADGVKSALWKVIQGTATINNPNVDSTFAKAQTDGLYVFSLTGTSNKGAVGTAFDSVIYVANKPPIAQCGQSYNDTTTSGILTGNGTDPEGGAITFLWQQVNGPNTAVITSPTFQNPLITNLITGTYIFSLTITDDGGLTSTCNQTVYVQLPVTLVKTVITTTKYFSDGTSTTTTVTVP